MADSFPRSPWLLKGAFVEIGSGFLGAVPQAIIFQYNPGEMTRTLEANKQAAKDTSSGCKKKTKTAQPKDPTETIKMKLELDAAFPLENPKKYPLAFATGIGDRLAALESLMFPKSGSLLGELGTTVGESIGLGKVLPDLERKTVPLALFVWGPGRIVPIRITKLTITEKEFLPFLMPLRAEVTVEMVILRPGEYPSDLNYKIAAKVAKFTYDLYRVQQSTLAAANVGNTVQSIGELFQS